MARRKACTTNMRLLVGEYGIRHICLNTNNFFGISAGQPVATFWTAAACDTGYHSSPYLCSCAISDVGQIKHWALWAITIYSFVQQKAGIRATLHQHQWMCPYFKICHVEFVVILKLGQLSGSVKCTPCSSIFNQQNVSVWSLTINCCGLVIRCLTYIQ